LSKRLDTLSSQEAILRSLGEYTAKMPDFQKTENMTLILSKVPCESDQRQAEFDTEVQHILMKALYMVAEKQIRLVSTSFWPLAFGFCFLAFGLLVFGCLAFDSLAFGLLAFWLLGFGLLALGLLAFGLLVFGLLAFGLSAFGLLAFGLWSFGFGSFWLRRSP
jgi:hypothetical protein